MQAEALTRHMRQDQLEDAVAQLLLFPQVPELAQSGFIRQSGFLNLTSEMARSQGSVPSSSVAVSDNFYN